MGLAALLAVPGQAAPFQYDCRSTLGEHPNLWIERTGPNYRVRGTLTSIRLERWPYPPGPLMMRGNTIPPTLRGANVSIGSSTDGNHVSLQVFAAPGVDGEVAVAVVFARDEDRAIGPSEGHRDVTTLTWDTLGRVSLPFEITADAEGVTVDVAGQRIRFEVRIGMEGEIRVGCEGGDFMFRELDWDL